MLIDETSQRCDRRARADLIESIVMAYSGAKSDRAGHAMERAIAELRKD